MRWARSIEFEIQTSVGDVHVILDETTAIVIPLHLNVEDFEQYDDIEELTDHVQTSAGLPEDEARKICEEMLARLPRIVELHRRGRWRLQKRDERAAVLAETQALTRFRST